MGAAFFLLSTAVVHPALADEGDEPGAEPSAADSSPAASADSLSIGAAEPAAARRASTLDGPDATY